MTSDNKAQGWKTSFSHVVLSYFLHLLREKKALLLSLQQHHGCVSLAMFAPNIEETEFLSVMMQ